MNTSIHIAFHIFFLFHVCCIWHLIYLYGMILMYSHLIHVFLFLYESTSLRNGSHSKLKLWHFHAKLVILIILHQGHFEIPIFRDLNSIFNTGYLYSFEAKVLMVLLQLELPKSEHRNSSYVLNNRDYSMFNTEPNIGLNIAPL